MAGKSPDGGKKITKKVTYDYVHRLAAAVSLLAFFVIVTAGVMASASVITMTMRSLVVIVVISFIARVVVRVLASYEEIHSGKA